MQVVLALESSKQRWALLLRELWLVDEKPFVLVVDNLQELAELQSFLEQVYVWRPQLRGKVLYCQKKQPPPEVCAVVFHWQPGVFWNLPATREIMTWALSDLLAWRRWPLAKRQMHHCLWRELATKTAVQPNPWWLRNQELLWRYLEAYL